jgi:acetyl-CoA carboxylase biotin carboxyl carrier protein
MGNGVTVDAEAIRKLAEILRDTDLSEIEVSEKDARIRVARILTAPPAQYFAAPPQMAMQAPMQAPMQPGPQPVVPESGGYDEKHPGLVTSPMVGVAYLAAGGAQPPPRASVARRSQVRARRRRA